MEKFGELLASDSELVMKPIREFLGFDSEKKTESGWATLYDNEGAPYRVHIEEKVAEAAARKAEKEAQKQKEKEQSAEDKKKFDLVIKRLEMLSNGRKGVNYIPYRNTKDYAIAGFISEKMNKEINQVLDHAKKNNFQTVEEVWDYLDKSGVRKHYKELYDQCTEIHEKIVKNSSWNGKIYTYKNGDKAVFLNDKKVVLSDDEYDYLDALVPTGFK